MDTLISSVRNWPHYQAAMLWLRLGSVLTLFTVVIAAGLSSRNQITIVVIWGGLTVLLSRISGRSLQQKPTSPSDTGRLPDWW